MQGTEGLHTGVPDRADGLQVRVCMGKKWYQSFVYKDLEGKEEGQSESTGVGGE